MTASTGERDNREHAFQMPPGPGDVPADTFALRLVASRHHAGRLSIEKAANRCGIEPEQWRRCEAGSEPRDPGKVEFAEMVAQGLRMNLHWLLFGGMLLPARGRPTKRPSGLNPGSVQRPIRPADTRPIGRPANAPTSATRTRQRARLIDRTQAVAV